MHNIVVEIHRSSMHEPFTFVCMNHLHLYVYVLGYVLVRMTIGDYGVRLKCSRSRWQSRWSVSAKPCSCSSLVRQSFESHPCDPYPGRLRTTRATIMRHPHSFGPFHEMLPYRPPSRMSTEDPPRPRRRSTTSLRCASAPSCAKRRM